MTVSPLALVPLTSALLYVALIAVVRRRAPDSPRARAFVLFLAFLASNGTASFIWRVTQGTPATEYLLRALTFPMLSAASAFLLLVQALYPTRWARHARLLVVAGFATSAAVAFSGASNRVVVDADPSPEPWHLALFGLGMVLVFVSQVASLGYLLSALASNRDPFERNRLKYIVASIVIITLGFLTNLVPGLRRLPIDQATNAVAASLLAFSVLRYRLFDADLVIRKGVLVLLVTIPTAVVYVNALLLALRYFEVDIESVAGAGVAAGLGVLGAVIAMQLRTAAEALVDELFVGRRLDQQGALAVLTRGASELRDLEELARDITTTCQPALDSQFVALLLLDGRDERFERASLDGPMAALCPPLAVSADNTILGPLIEANEPVTPLALASALDAPDAARRDVEELEPVRDCVLVPVRGHERVVALLVVGAKVYDAAFTISDLEFLQLAAVQAGLALENARLFQQLRQAAQTDFITGLPNHRRLQELLRDMLHDARFRNVPLSVAMVDLDNFKLYNDVHGHQLGDEALRRLGAVMRAGLRECDIVGRYGGDEFLVVMPGASRQTAAELLAGISRQVRKTALAVREGNLAAAEQVPARISWGVATFPDDGEGPRALISAADSQLLQHRVEARRSGTVHTGRPATGRLLESDPEKLRVARNLIDLIDAKDPYTSEHSQQIASFSLLVADELGLPDAERYAIWLGSLLHDVGKIGMPEEILRKPGRLTPRENVEMRRHPMIGEEIVRGLLDIPQVNEIVGCHHEHYDGTGYPRGLAGDDIPKMARLVSVADTFSAMVHDRPYRKGLSWDEAVLELRRAAGTQLDPEMVDVFISAIGQGGRTAA